MIRKELQRLLGREPFEPFRIKLMNGEHIDIFDPNSLALHPRTAHLASADQHWVIFALLAVNSIESLIADYHGELARHDRWDF